VIHAGSKDPLFLDTYAQLLYKGGKLCQFTSPDNYLEIETRVVGLLNNDANSKERFERMKRGEKNWE
jgi:hypothetical protein